MIIRGSGILLHVTSLPSAHGIGDLGPGAYRFADFLTETEQSYWQLLPLNPTNAAFGNSPYSSYSAFAGNPLLISPELLVHENRLSPSDLADIPSPDTGREQSAGNVDYSSVTGYKKELLRRAFERTRGILEHDRGFLRFCRDNSNWLEDYALFIALKDHFGGRIWSQWPAELRDRQDHALREHKEMLRESVLLEKLAQYLFFKQWLELRKYCNDRGVRIIGDIPIYVNYDSSDVWADPEVFKLDGDRRMQCVAGVPPDYFSATGQLWGNPVYDWDRLKNTNYAWWVRRMEHNLKLFDQVRLDHFRGFVAYWEVPAGEETAVNGTWVECPVEDFFKKLFRHFPCLPVIAEDLGTITADVREVIRRLGFPGMKVLMFAFGGDMATNPYIPHRIPENSVVYTGTHDNNTVRGWIEGEAGQEERRNLFRYLGREVPAGEAPGELVRLALMSVAKTAVLPMQDVLGLGEESRMNRPATTHGNWSWRLPADRITASVSQKLLEMTKTYGRSR